MPTDVRDPSRTDVAEPARAAGGPLGIGPWLERLLRFNTSPSRPELLIGSALLTLFGAVIFASHVLHGALYLDDFSNGAGTLYPPGGQGIGHAISYFGTFTIYRPVLVVYVPLTFAISGTHASIQLSLAALWAVTVGICAYGVLRSLGVAVLHALVIAGLILAYPWYDALRMWSTASQASLSITFALGGLWAALTGLRRRSWRWHIGAAALYLASILTYEVAIPAILGAGIAYGVRFGWRATIRRWLADIATVAAGTAWVYSLENHKSFGLSADLAHARQIAAAGVTILGRSVISLGIAPRTTLAVGGLGAVLAVGLAISLARGRGATRWDAVPRPWLWMVVGGIILALLGWVIFVPADPYYTPSVYGFTNRVNAVAGLGLVVLVYGVLGFAGHTTRIATRTPPVAAAIVTIGLAGLLGATYVRVLERHARIWNAAGRLEAEGMTEIRSRFPHLAAGTTLFVAGYPANETLGVPIFSAEWDLNGYIQLAYHDARIDAYPILPGWQFSCGPRGVALTGTGAPPTATPYGKAWLVNLGTNQVTRPRSPRECAQAAPRYGPGPLYLTTSY